MCEGKGREGLVTQGNLISINYPLPTKQLLVWHQVKQGSPPNENVLKHSNTQEHGHISRQHVTNIMVATAATTTACSDIIT